MLWNRGTLERFRFVPSRCVSLLRLFLLFTFTEPLFLATPSNSAISNCVKTKPRTQIGLYIYAWCSLQLEWRNRNTHPFTNNIEINDRQIDSTVEIQKRTKVFLNRKLNKSLISVSHREYFYIQILWQWRGHDDQKQREDDNIDAQSERAEVTHTLNTVTTDDSR